MVAIKTILREHSIFDFLGAAQHQKLLQLRVSIKNFSEVCKQKLKVNLREMNLREFNFQAK